MKLSDAMTPGMVVEELAQRGVHISERTLRERARKMGTFRTIGKAMFFMPEDIDALLEAAKPAARGTADGSGRAWTDEDTAQLRDQLVRGQKR